MGDWPAKVADTTGSDANRNAVLYLRVSTEDQDLAGQEAELRSYAAVRGWAVVATYREKVSASGRVEREQFELLLNDAKTPARGWSRVLVWALDRWSREPSFVKAIGSIETLEQAGISWHSFKEPQLDSGNDAATNLARDLLRGILPTIAAFEARRRSERTLVAMREIKAGKRRTRSGKPPGRPRKVTPAVASKILELRNEVLPNGKHRTWGQIARTVHLPAGTCSKVPRTRRAESATSEKGPGGFGENAVASSHVPAPLPPAQRNP